MRVLVVIPGDGRGVPMVFARRQADSLERAGLEVRRFFLGSRTAPVTLARERRRYRAEIAAFDPAIIHVHFGTMTGFFATHGTARPVVVTFHGSDLNPCPSANSFRVAVGHALSQLAARRAQGVICVSRELLGRIVWGRDRATVIPMGVDVGRFAPLPRREARDRLGWHHEDPVVLFNAGRAPRVKRLDLAEAAFAVARMRRPDLRLEVLRGDVEPDAVPLHLNAANVLLFNSDFEGSPMIVKEAVACGLPVVSVKVGDVPERLMGVTPSAIVERNPAALGAAVVELIEDGRRSNGPDVAAREFSEECVARQVLEVYRRVVGSPLEADIAMRIVANNGIQ